ncbi:MAG: hypothetical protein LUQ09_08680 [Methanomassiliicoccales archaeon]|nr:hypothetical protein [Methanomassiliicoccales archaeon]
MPENERYRPSWDPDGVVAEFIKLTPSARKVMNRDSIMCNLMKVVYDSLPYFSGAISSGFTPGSVTVIDDGLDERLPQDANHPPLVIISSGHGFSAVLIPNQEKKDLLEKALALGCSWAKYDPIFNTGGTITDRVISVDRPSPSRQRSKSAGIPKKGQRKTASMRKMTR